MEATKQIYVLFAGYDHEGDSPITSFTDEAIANAARDDRNAKKIKTRLEDLYKLPEKEADVMIEAERLNSLKHPYPNDYTADSFLVKPIDLIETGPDPTYTLTKWIKQSLHFLSTRPKKITRSWQLG